MMYTHYGYSPFHMFGSLLMVLLWIIVITTLIRYLRGGHRMRHWGGTQEKVSPKDILKERYAKGEITKEQFHEMKKEVE